MAKKEIKIGFDFDGVVAYNPLRVFRRPVMWALGVLGLKKRGELHYPVPDGKHHKFFWAILHETSFFPAIGFDELKELLKKDTVKGYLITGRYSFLKKALMRWLKFRKIDNLFAGLYLNDQNEQPHLYKERMIKKLNLDMFVEDNWDIVKYLNSKFEIRNLPVRQAGSKLRHPEIHWIYNILDRDFQYKYKHPYMKDFISYLKEKELV